MKRIEKHIFLLLAAVTIGCSVLYFLLLERNEPGATEEQYISAVQQRVKEEMQVSTSELDSVSALLVRNPKPAFTEYFKLPSRYPFFVFRDGQLMYWSDYRFVPDYAWLSVVTTTPRLIDFEQGRFVVSHRRVTVRTEVLDVYSLVNIHRSYHSNNAYLQSGYNPEIFSLDPQAVTDKRLNTYEAIYDNTSAFLFSVVPPKVDVYRNHSTPVNTVILATLGVIFLGLYVLQLMIRLRKKRRYEWGFVVLATYLLLLRAVMLYFGVPFLFVESDLFNPKYYASSVLIPSLGDLLLNALVIAILAFYWVRYYFRSQLYVFLLNQPHWLKLILSVACVVLSYVTFTLCYIELTNIYEKSQFTLDITLNIHFSFLKVACLVVFIIVSCIYFLVTHLLASLFLRYNRINHAGIGLLLIVAGSALGAGIWLLIGGVLEPVFLLNGIYFLVIYVSQLPKTLYTFRYKTSIYLFLAAFICAVMTSYVVYNQEIRKQLSHQQVFASQLLAENDVFGEFLMSKAQESIQKDAEIARALRSDTLLVRERIQQRVKSLHLDKYFDKYDIQVFSFRANGRPLDISPDALSLSSLTTRYRQATYNTEYPGLYFVNEANNQFVKQYICFVPIQRLQTSSSLGRSETSVADTLGYVVLDFRLRNERPKGVYPELLVDTKFRQNQDTQEYSYALYTGPRLGSATVGPSKYKFLYSPPGNFNYDRNLELSQLNNPTLFTTGISRNHYQHIAQRGQDGRVVVVSSPEYPFRNIFSNFSFLYLLLVLTVILVITCYAINYRFSKFNINYSTRIQILLNLAFFLPLIFVILIILGVISSNYVDNQKDTYIINTRNIAANFLVYLDEHLYAQKRSKASMEEELAKIARDANIDINLFDAEGKLYTSTRPLIYESGYLSKRINPEAYIHIIEDKESQILLDESLGSKKYRTAYASIKSFNGQLLGVLSIPYFYAQPELDRKIIEVIATSLSIFTALFLFFLILSYFASHMLTKPLRLLTQKIRKTNLERPNDPLPWQSDDEIGLLIREYNRMLLKLEESKQALAQTEKQSAWREMAKQIAHEIKNPLTPMKLTLQHLQRTLPTNGKDTAGLNGDASRKVIRTFDSLLDHIETISDIANSFSEFAKIPMPKKEEFEVTGVFNKTADLYADDKRITLQRESVEGPIMVLGDRQFMGRIMTNLLINAIQSVPSDRKPVIDLKLSTSSESVLIEVHDNGVGIPEAIRNKVFLPNFSTKGGGSGLGLWIAKRGVEHADGSIWFETVEGVGTSFFVSMPLAGAPGQGGQ
ncbi:sensor histidine kinase [Spirosoma gilvum]